MSTAPVIVDSREVLRAYLATQVAQLRAAAPHLDDPESVHVMRVRARRLRSVVRGYRPWIHVSGLAWLESELRWFGRTLSPLRDLDVIADGVRALDVGEPAISHWLAVLADERAAELDRTRASLAGGQVRHLMRSLDRLVHPVGWFGDRGVIDVEAARLVQQDRVATRLALARGLTEEDPGYEAGWHDVRKAAKQLRFTCEVFAANDPVSAVVAADAARIQSELGQHLDDLHLRAWIEHHPR